MSRLPATAIVDGASARDECIAVFCRPAACDARDEAVPARDACRTRRQAFVVLVKSGMMVERRADPHCEKELAGNEIHGLDRRTGGCAIVGNADA